MERLSDEELAGRAGSGDWKAFDRLVRRYWRRICGYAFTLLRSWEDAEDAAQETFLKAFRGRMQFEDGKPFAPWLYRIATNACIDRKRSRKREDASIGDVEVADPGETPAELYERQDVRMRVREALFSLPRPYAEVVYLRYGEGMSYREIGMTLDISEGAVETRLFRGKRMIREQLRRTLKWES